VKAEPSSARGDEISLCTRTQTRAGTAAPPPKSFVEKVRDCDAGTGVWFITAGSVEHAAIEKRSGDGAVVILTDAGVTEVVPASNLFATAEEARAARY
jgi:hypothetical protein